MMQTLPRFRSVLFIGLWLALWSTAGAFAADSDQPAAVFPERRYEFSSVNEGEPVKHDFVVENHGRAPLNITKVQPD